MSKKIITAVMLLLLSTSSYSAVNPVKISAQEDIFSLPELLETLSEKYHISDLQKQEMRGLLISEVPSAINLFSELMTNRTEIMSLNLRNYNEQRVEELAISQGQLITELIIWKESLKMQLRQILDDEQQEYINDLLQQFLISRVLLTSQIKNILN